MVRPRQISDDAILKAARRFFLEHGPGLATGVIAKSLGISQATLFNRFGTKEELLRASLNIPTATWAEELESGPTSEPIGEQLQAIGLAILDFLRQMMPVMVTLRAAGLNPPDFIGQGDTPPPVCHHQKLSRWFEQAHERGLLKVPSASTAAQAFMGTLHARAMMQHIWKQPMVPLPDELYIAQFVNTLLVGLQQQSEEP
ncbi:MAG: TetR/AcrR family transcriptional regulator [Myxococcota bacterium]|nr:TetR/AcrR family transcriptional regulator [Myxococcota bacterium]